MTAADMTRTLDAALRRSSAATFAIVLVPATAPLLRRAYGLADRDRKVARQRNAVQSRSINKSSKVAIGQLLAAGS
jgi:hypothetical protein